MSLQRCALNDICRVLFKPLLSPQVHTGTQQQASNEAGASTPSTALCGRKRKRIQETSGRSRLAVTEGPSQEKDDV